MPRSSEQVRESEAALLDQTQAYLEYRSRGLDPPPPLPTAWNRFYGYYVPKLRHAFARWNLPVAERDDCFQEVWVAVVAQLPQFRRDGVASFSTWLITLARNKRADALRHRGIHRVEGLFDDSLLGIGPDPATAYECHEVRQQVRAVLAELSAGPRREATRCSISAESKVGRFPRSP